MSMRSRLLVCENAGKARFAAAIASHASCASVEEFVAVRRDERAVDINLVDHLHGGYPEAVLEHTR